MPQYERGTTHHAGNTTAVKEDQGIRLPDPRSRAQFLDVHLIDQEVAMGGRIIDIAATNVEKVPAMEGFVRAAFGADRILGSAVGWC